MRMKPVMDLARKYHAADSDPAGLFVPISAGFKIFCNETDNPGGKRSFAPGVLKRIASVAQVTFHWSNSEAITGLDVRLADPADAEWVCARISALFAEANINLPPCNIL